MIETIQNASSFFNLLAGIFNIGLGVVNIYLFIQNREERHSRLGRDIKIKESDLEALRQRHRQEHEDLEASYEGEIRVREFSRADLRTDNDRQREARLFEKQRNEEERIWAELGHLYELRDGQQGYLVQKESKIQQFWNAIRRFFKHV